VIVLVIDSSALVAIFRLEPEGDHFNHLIAMSHWKVMAAPNLLETAMVIAGRHGNEGLLRLDDYIRNAAIRIVPFTADHALVARQAFLSYGKGRHPAALNFGDCIAYATARLEVMPLLFKGDDFKQTDVEAAA
jgi:ribonuclease VapC